jgi:purine-binding chemotaxis protein CheW
MTDLREAPSLAAAGARGDDQELVTCVLGNVEFGLDINAVQEIVRMPRITPVPMAPRYVEGVANLRGNVLPIINSRARFGMPAGENRDSHRVVVVELNGSPTGLIVDAVREVMHVSRKVVEEVPAVVHDVDGRFLKGIVKLDQGRRLVLLLDHDAVLDRQAERAAVRAGSGPASGREGRPEGGEEDHEHLVTFRLTEEEYGISIMDVQEIIRVPAISTVPKAPPAVIGIASLRNRILPVVDLRTQFGFRPLKEEAEAFCERLRSFEQQHREAVRRLEQAVNGSEPFDREALRGYRTFDRWHDSFSTADKLLRALLAPLKDASREASEAVRRVLAALEAGNAEAARREFQAAVRPANVRLTVLFEKLYAGVARRDDERCLVVNVGGTSVALRVDAVNQVLQAPRGAVEATPQLVAGRDAGQEPIRGVAKLEGGRRLIMLLNVPRLLSQADLDALQRVAEGPREAAAETAARSTEEDERQFVSFKVASEEFAVDIMQVQEIIRLEKVTRVPNAPDFVEGMVNLRGSVLPVIDLRKRVRMPGKDYNDATRVVVVDLKGRKTGIIVDAVSEVMRVNRRSIEPAPALVKSTYGDHFIEGVGKLDNGERMFLLLRADELLRDDEREALAVPG